MLHDFHLQGTQKQIGIKLKRFDTIQWKSIYNVYIYILKYEVVKVCHFKV